MLVKDLIKTYNKGNVTIHVNNDRYKNTVELNEHLTDMVKTYVVIPPKTEIKLKVIIEI